MIQPSGADLLEVLSAPEVSCEEWSSTMCALPHAPGPDSGADATNWIAADQTHVALRVRLATTGTSADDAWGRHSYRFASTREATVERYVVDEIELGAATPPAVVPFLYLVRMDVDESRDEEFNRWYTEDHVANLSTVPGVLSARRFRARNAGPDVRRYLALYYLACPSVRQTAAWQRAAHTDWSIRIRAHHRRKLATMFSPSSGAPHCGRRADG